MAKPCVAVLGDLNWDLVLRVPYLPRRGGEVLSGEAKLRLGGSATNTARWLSRLGFEARLFAAVGDDPLGRLAQEELKKEGLATAFLRVHPGPTGLCCALVDEGGERTLLTRRGVNALLSPPLPEGWLRGAQWLHISGYALLEEGSRAAVEEALAQARRLGLPVSLDPGMVAVHGHGEHLRALAPVDVFLPSWEEAQALTGTADPEQALAELLRFGRIVFLKRGVEGCLAGDGKARVHVPAIPVEARDPVGAGDAFDAGVIAARLCGGSLLAQAALGNLLGALAAADLPPTRLPSLAERLPPAAQREVMPILAGLGA